MNSKNSLPFVFFNDRLPALDIRTRRDVIETIKLVDYLVSVGEIPADANEQAEYLYAYYPSVFDYSISLNTWINTYSERTLDTKYLSGALTALKQIVSNIDVEDINSS